MSNNHHNHGTGRGNGSKNFFSNQYFAISASQEYREHLLPEISDSANNSPNNNSVDNFNFNLNSSSSNHRNSAFPLPRAVSINTAAGDKYFARHDAAVFGTPLKSSSTSTTNRSSSSSGSRSSRNNNNNNSSSSSSSSSSRHRPDLGSLDSDSRNALLWENMSNDYCKELLLECQQQLANVDQVVDSELKRRQSVVNRPYSARDQTQHIARVSLPKDINMKLVWLKADEQRHLVQVRDNEGERERERHTHTHIYSLTCSFGILVGGFVEICFCVFAFRVSLDGIVRSTFVERR